MTGRDNEAAQPADLIGGSPIEKIDPDELLTVGELSALLKVSRRWVYDQVAARRIPYLRLGRSLRFRHTEVRGYLDEQTHLPVARRQSTWPTAYTQDLESLDS